ncbi:(2Fe-2S)-binding protein [Streptomyces sp. MspMP-M5]|uniref:(2Fe-2S)-binding protein n=1 Tax=unclassified Streptomyces TaxID=2593676 RepID=UPI00035DA4C9|nr:(2Fe-2S)-binding protein [Streptomyces sp. MspMP-M5]MYT27810.1 (2Fe-2S)-binding protein [Streptomyces sp. SID8354]
MYVCSCFGITEQQVREHADRGACTPRQVASACKAGTDCGSCVRRIQALLGRGACPRRELIDSGAPDALRPESEPSDPEQAPGEPAVPSVPAVPLAAEAAAPAPAGLRAVA